MGNRSSLSLVAKPGHVPTTGLRHVVRDFVMHAICVHAVCRALLLQAIPRVTSKGVVCGAVYKVASAQNIDSA